MLEKATPEAAVDYLFSLQIVIKYYRFLEIKQEDIIRKTLKKEIKKNSKKESKRESNKDVKKESENENGVGLGLGLAPTNSSRSSINNSIISSSATHSIQDKTNKGISFTKRLLRRSTPNTASPKSVSPASSRSSLGSSSFHGSMTPLTPLTPSSPMPLTGSMNSPQTRKTSMGSSKQQTSNINEFKKSDLPRDIWKDSRALHVLNAANLIHESALSFMPDPYQSCLSVLELMAVIYDDISFMLENSRYNFVSLSEMEYSLISIEENLFSMLIGQAFQIIDAATLDIPFGCQPRDVGMLLGHLESMVVS